MSIGPVIRPFLHCPPADKQTPPFLRNFDKQANFDQHKNYKHMKKINLLLAIGLPLTTLLIAGFARRPAASRPASGPFGIIAPRPSGFAVVELFTSEGCSSCPPADKALAELAAEYPDQAYVLGFHVDYWNRLGWKDIYSAAGYTQRQQEYAARFNLQSIYTPEAIVNGRKEFVGSDQPRIEAAVKEELAATSNNSLDLSATATERKVIVKYNVKEAPAGLTLQVALVQSKASSQVLRGENQGLQLQHINVVRDFQSLSSLSGGAGNVALKIPSGLSAKDCKVIAYLQSKDGHITGAGTTAIQ
jgi:hypothetical protein